MSAPTPSLADQLEYLKLAFIREHYEPLARQAAKGQWPPSEYLAKLVEGEVHRRQDRALQRRIQAARFPVLKTLDDFQWNWPKSINRMHIQQLFRLAFLEQRANVIFVGGVGLGKTHLATALAYASVVAGHTVLFSSAIDAVNTLTAAQANQQLKHALARYTKPRVLLLDEVGYLPIDKIGADLLFQIISQRYERGSTIITTNRPYKKWPTIFNNDSTLTSALLDRLLHHAETIVIEGTSFRMKERLQDP